MRNLFPIIYLLNNKLINNMDRTNESLTLQKYQKSLLNSTKDLYLVKVKSIKSVERFVMVPQVSNVFILRTKSLSYHSTFQKGIQSL